MASNLVIVESPAKANTIAKYLGPDFKVLASYGHVRDLKPKTGAVDTESGFSMEYVPVERNEKHVTAITKALKKADRLLLATDPDREGEAISWHLYELLNDKKLLEGKDVQRVVFYEITKNAVREAVDNPRKLSDELVNAQQARRALDYLVGFNLSPLLWKKVSRGLSAGRVQSPALRLICEREAEIDKFIAREYWSIESDLTAAPKQFSAKLTHFQEEKLKQFTITEETRAREVETELNRQANGKLNVEKVEHKERKRNPVAPFTTSTLQQEASRKIGFGAARTMRLAQQLYEGIDIDGETIGLITYMRTDAVVLASDAVEEIRGLITQRFGNANLPDAPNSYANKSKNAQEAHEAIRPTSALRTPDLLKASLDNDQWRLYDLIWKRAVASQMLYATLNTTSIDMSAGAGNIFRSTGTTIVNPGFMAVYLEGEDDSTENDKKSDDKETLLPDVKAGDTVDLNAIHCNQHFTEPPPRYTEASLIKTLESYGIGRPSTYVSILTTLVNREYVDKDGKRFTPTEMGKVVNTFLSTHFEKYVDYDFTANLEDQLDAISRGEEKWVPVLERFWDPFKKLVDEKEESVTRAEAVLSRDIGIDPKSGRPVSVRMGRYGPIVQIGTKDDEEKPKFAGLRPGQKMDKITFEEAMELFKLPRDLGETEEGEKVSANIGRFGPYIRYGSKFVSLKDDDPYKVELPKALEIIAEKKIIDANRIIHDFTEEGIQVLNGRYGPYITDGNKNAKIPKETEPKELTLEQCKELLAAAPERRRGKKKVAKKVAAKKVTKKKVTKKKTAKKAKKKTTKKKVAKKKVTKKVVVAEKSENPPF